MAFDSFVDQSATEDAIKNHTTTLDLFYGKWELLVKKGFQITGEEAIKLLTSKDANLVGILDFRKDSPSDHWNLKIKDALNYPLDEGPSATMFRLGESAPPDAPAMAKHIE